MEDKYYTINQACEILQTTRPSIYRWIKDGKLEVTRFGVKNTRIAQSELQRFLGKDKELVEL